MLQRGWKNAEIIKCAYRVIIWAKKPVAVYSHRCISLSLLDIPAASWTEIAPRCNGSAWDERFWSWFIGNRKIPSFSTPGMINDYLIQKLKNTIRNALWPDINYEPHETNFCGLIRNVYEKHQDQTRLRNLSCRWKYRWSTFRRRDMSLETLSLLILTKPRTSSICIVVSVVSVISITLLYLFILSIYLFYYYYYYY